MKYTWNGHVGSVTYFIYSEYVTWRQCCHSMYWLLYEIKTFWWIFVLGQFLITSSQSVGNDIEVTQSWCCGLLESTGCLLQCVQCLMSFPYTCYKFSAASSHKFDLINVLSAPGFPVSLLLKFWKSFKADIAIFGHCDNFHFNLKGMKK